MEKANEVVVDRINWCDFCRLDGLRVEAKFDGKTKAGPWGMMCPMHFNQFGVGLGLGIGQRLILEGEQEHVHRFIDCGDHPPNVCVCGEVEK